MKDTHTHTHPRLALETFAPLVHKRGCVNLHRRDGEGVRQQASGGPDPGLQKEA